MILHWLISSLLFFLISCCQMKVYLIRHAESLYNVGQAALEKKLGEGYLKSEEYQTFKFIPSLLDASITENGVKQCEQARKIMADTHIDVVIVSPLRRALQTCWQIFKDHPSKPQIVVDPLFKEILESTCDIGNRLEQSIQDYPGFDFSRVQNPKTWYVDTIYNPYIKKLAQEKLTALNEEQLINSEKIALTMLEFIKQLYFKEVAPDTHEDMLARHKLQVEHLKEFYKGKTVAVVSHSENLKHFIGWKIKNCEIKEYAIEFDKE